jgi:RNA polymerase sigma-70 factor (ECF subfamily)
MQSAALRSAEKGCVDQDAHDMITGLQTGAEPDSQDPAADERRLVEALRAGDESAFERLIGRYHRSLLRLAMLYVPSRAIAEEVVQETWLGVLQGLARFEGRSSLKTWIFRILTNRARTRGQREGRTIAFSDLASVDAGSGETNVDPDLFWPADHPAWANTWVSYPRNWNELPEDRLLSRETLARVQAAIAALPPTQREVITLRDVQGWSSEEVCNILEISETNQRVLLHRARAKVRRDVDLYLNKE